MQKSKIVKIQIKIFKIANEVSSHENFDFEKNINDEKMIESETMKYVFLIEKLFYRMSLNESHKIRFSKTKINLTIFKLDVIICFFFMSCRWFINSLIYITRWCNFIIKNELALFSNLLKKERERKHHHDNNLDAFERS